jgi:hypothetical protein
MTENKTAGKEKKTSTKRGTAAYYRRNLYQ